MKFRYESFGGIFYSEKKAAQIFVSKEFARRAGYKNSPLWSTQVNYLSAPCEVHFSITNKCPLKCPHCYVDGGSALKNELALEDLKRSIDVLADLNVFQVAFGGGEPFAHPALFELASYARSKGIVPNITTNGFYVDDATAKKASVFGQINVSIDGISGPALKLRGEESFLVVDKAIGLLRKQKVNVGINTVLSTANFDHLIEISKYAKSCRVEEILLLRYKPLGRGQEGYNDMALRADHLKKLIPLTQEISRATTIRFRMDCSLFPALAHRSVPVEKLRYWGISGCDAGNNLVSLTPEGKFKACSFCFDCGGDIFGLKDKWSTSSHLRFFRDWAESAPEPCNVCCYLELCKGGCHPIAEVETGSTNNPDPACPISTEYFEGKLHPALSLKENHV